jgi:hypothetical protein
MTTIKLSELSPRLRLKIEEAYHKNKRKQIASPTVPFYLKWVEALKDLPTEELVDLVKDFEITAGAGELDYIRKALESSDNNQRDIAIRALKTHKNYIDALEKIGMTHLR